jgi:hypothetical protein
VPGSGSTLPGVTWKVCVDLPSSVTSQTRSSSTEYTTRAPVPDRAGRAVGFLVSRGALVVVEEALACGSVRSAGTFAEAWKARNPTVAKAAAVSAATKVELLPATATTSSSYVRASRRR